MSQINIDIAVIADDGIDHKLTGGSTSIFINTGANYATHKWTSWATGDDNWIIVPFFRFDDITLELGAVINSATLKLYSFAAAGTGASMDVTVKAFDENDPAAPTAGSDIIGKTAGIASNVVTTAWAAETTKNPTDTASYNLRDIDVTDIVQELVDSYEYDSQAMMFFITQASAIPQTVYPNKIWFYNSNWGASKDPELVIDYSAPLPPGGYVGSINGVDIYFA